jgi:hypothetical protein
MSVHDHETASLTAALNGELRWYCTGCQRRLGIDESPAKHGCPSPIVAVEIAARSAEELNHLTGDIGLPSGAYWVSIAKNDEGIPLSVYGPIPERLQS